MDALRTTQFAHITPDTENLPPFLAKKLEEAIVKAYLKKQNDKTRLEDKLRRAELKRQEKLSQQKIRLIQHFDKVQQAHTRKINSVCTYKELAEQVLQTKLELAAQKAIEKKEQIKLHAQQMGTQKVNNAKMTREAIKAIEDQKRHSKPVKGRVIKISKDQEISDFHKARNYEILKKLNRKRFNTLVEADKKKENLIIK